MTNNRFNAIAHVDCDAFYASCEAVRHPELKGRPICVLSSQNAIVVAKSYDAKALGITTGMPVWEARKLAPHAVFLAADFRYYGQVSDKVFAILRSYSPDIEIYSIDEAFMDMNGIRLLWHKSFCQLAEDIRMSIWRDTGITASVGIANTRTLAKMASESSKPNGISVVSGKRIEHFLNNLAVVDIPGIGRNRAALLHKFEIHTALEFVRLGDGLMQRLLGHHGMQLKQELSGRPVLPLLLKPGLPKSIARTASMGCVTIDRKMIMAHVSRHVMRLVSELVSRRLLTRRLQLFLTRHTFEHDRLSLPLDVPSNSFKRIMAAIKTGFCSLHRAGQQYRGCGVIAVDISHEMTATNDLFGLMADDKRQARLMLTVNAVNRKYGNQTLSLAAASRIRLKSNQPRFRYPVLIAS